MRGSHTFKELFSQQETPRSGKGRNAVLVADRDHLLIARYFFYGTYTSLRFESIIKNISGEFFLSERRVSDIVEANISTLKQLRAEPPSIKDLRAKWPHLSWN